MAASKIENAPWVRLGDLIEINEIINAENRDLEFLGINRNKEFMPSVANTDGLDKSKYKVISKGKFVFSGMQTGRDVCIRFGLYDREEPGLISPAYTTYCVKKESVLPEYIMMNFKRSEMDRLGWFLSDSSIRSNLDFDRFLDIKIPLPSIETQRELAAVYNELKELAEENEKLLEPLSKSCEAFIVDCKKKYAKKRLGDLIEDIDIKNSDNKIKAVKSVSVTKEFKETGAKVNKEELSGYKLVPPRHLSYVQTTKNEKCFANALNTSNETYVVTSVNKVIKSKDESILDIGFLHLFLRRNEFDRFAIFNSWGSAREVFSYEDLCNAQIPLPPIQIQQKIVDLYNCYEECKRIAKEAREKISNLCPALVQKAAHTY